MPKPDEHPAPLPDTPTPIGGHEPVEIGVGRTLEGFVVLHVAGVEIRLGAEEALELAAHVRARALASLPLPEELEISEPEGGSAG